MEAIHTRDLYLFMLTCLFSTKINFDLAKNSRLELFCFSCSSFYVLKRSVLEEFKLNNEQCKIEVLLLVLNFN